MPEVEFTLNREEPANKAQAVINMASIGKELRSQTGTETSDRL